MQISEQNGSQTNAANGSARTSAPEPLRVYIVDDERPDLEWLDSVFSEAGYETRSFSGGADFLEAAEALPSGCVVLDVKLPGIDGLQVLKALASRRAEMPVVMISGKSDIPIAVEAMKLGALDFVVKPCKPADLRRAVEDAFRVASELAEKADRARYVEEMLDRISPREMQVLKLLLEGRRNKAVAFELGISERTVEVHRTRMMRRLGLGSFAELIRLAVQLGVATDPPSQKPRAS